MNDIKNIPFEELSQRFAPFIHKTAAKYTMKGLTEYDDLYQVGLFGLWKAQVNFDEKKASFTTYAFTCIVGWIRREVQKEGEKNQSRSDLKLIKDLEEKLEQNEMFEIPMKDLNVYLASKGIFSLDEPIGIYNDHLKNVMPDNSNFVDEILNEETIQELIQPLSSEEKFVIKKRFIDDFTRSEIANELNWDYRKVRRRELSGLKKVKEVYEKRNTLITI